MNLKPTAIIFPGQGSQTHGMGRELAESRPEIMDLWKKAERICNEPLREIYWDSEDEALMSNTRHLQPAVTLVNLGLWLEVRDKLTPACAAGHSLGEFSALGAARALDLDDLLSVVCLRGKLMAEADPEQNGTMYAVLRLPCEEVEKMAREASEQSGKMVKVANRNTPTQFAVSGHKDAIELLLDKVRDAKGKSVPLAVSGAFHTQMMAEASAEFAKALDKLAWNKPDFPIYCNNSGLPAQQAEELYNSVRKQMTSPVYWVDVVQNQWKSGVRRWVEFGPKGVLTRMLRPILSATGAQDQDYLSEHIANFADAKTFAG